MTRNQSIDLVKIIAMIMVVRMHIGLAHNLPPYELSRFVHGILCPAVPLFFMVSGYLMQCRMPDYRYIWGKIGRILKFIYIVIPISCVLTGIVVHHPRPYSLVTWIIGGGNMWQFWYFAAIIIVYALAPYICKMVASSKSHIYIAIMFLICAVVTIVNVYLGFEQTYVRQTFRLYYWIFYFMLGAYIKQNGHSEHINWIWVLSMMCAAVVFITPSLTSLFDNLYGSIVCAAYAYCIFCACLNTPVHDSKLISNLSSLFLPVYTLHPVAIKILANECAITPPIYATPLFFLLVLSSTMIVSWLIMKTPYVNKIFRI